MRPELITTLGYAWDRSVDQSSTYPTFGVRGRYWLDSDWHVGADLRYTSREGNLSTSQGLSGSAYTEKVLDAHWSMGLAMYANQSTVDTTYNPFNQPTYYRNNDLSVYAYLRWSEVRGSGLATLGLRGLNSVGGGRIQGMVFVDSNNDGEIQDFESGVPNIEVWLDERYRASTDANGRFEFPMAATGEHQLTLRFETIPLPWGEGEHSKQMVSVPLRGSATANLAVVKIEDAASK